MKKSVVLCMLMYIAHSMAISTVEVENADGSFSIGRFSHARGDTGDSVAAYLKGASGWNPQIARQTHALTPREEVGVSLGAQIPGLFSSSVSVSKPAPFVEILQLIESFIRFKGTIGNTLRNLWNDNAHIIAALQTTLINKVSSLHNLTLTAIIILRKILEFAHSLFHNSSVSVGAFF